MKQSIPKIIQARGFEVVDAKGRTTARLSEADGVPHLLLYDRRRKIQFWITLWADGTPEIRFYGPKGKHFTVLTGGITQGQHPTKPGAADKAK